MMYMIIFGNENIVVALIMVHKKTGLRGVPQKYIPESFFLTCLLQNVKLLYGNVILSNDLAVTMVTMW